MIDMKTASIVARTYHEEGEVDLLMEVETSEGEVDLVANPRLVTARTFSLSVEEAWRLSRELAKAATVAELGLAGD